MLININIFIFENIDFIIFTRINYIDNCNIIFQFIIISLTRFFVKQNIKFEKLIIILIYVYIIVSIEYISLFIENNFIFKLVIRCFITLFAIIINSLFHVVLIRNDLKKSINLFRKYQLKLIINLKINKCYYLNNYKKAYKMTFKLFK